jgi:hypothetical protein
MDSNNLLATYSLAECHTNSTRVIVRAILGQKFYD